jgi:hypothetical protein
MRRGISAALACAVGLTTWVAGASGASAASTFLVGDSVALGAQHPLQAAGVAVDAAVSRSFSQGVAVLRAQGAGLPSAVIVHLGTNSGVTAGQCDELAAVVGPARRLSLVTVNIPGSPQVAASANSVLASCAARHRATLVDWASYTRSNPQVLCGDGIHISCGGGQAYASFVLSNAAAASAGAGSAPASRPAPASQGTTGTGTVDPAAAAAAAAAERAAAERAAAERAALAEQQRQAAIRAEQERQAAEAARIAAIRKRLLQWQSTMKLLSPLDIDRAVSPENYRFEPFVAWLTAPLRAPRTAAAGSTAASQG